MVDQILSSFKNSKSTLYSSKYLDHVSYTNGTKYVGDVIRQGYGIFYDLDGSIYDGNWYDDTKSGVGKKLF